MAGYGPRFSPNRTDPRSLQPAEQQKHSTGLKLAARFVYNTGLVVWRAERDPAADNRGWGPSTRSILAAETISPDRRGSAGNQAAQPAHRKEYVRERFP
jgi:hypothetical protein